MKTLTDQERKEMEFEDMPEKFTCPILKDEEECKFVNDYFCPHSAIPIMDIAIEKNLEDCPFDESEK